MVDVRHATHPKHVRLMTTQELRENFLVEELFVPDTVTAVYSHHDRVVLAGVTPQSAPLVLTGFPELRATNFFENREAGIVNVGGAGTVRVGGESYEMAHGACLYLGRENENPTFQSSSGSDSARFYVFSAPAHTTYDNALVEPGSGNVRELGDQSGSNRRTLNQYIHENGVQSCQVVMGVTTLHEGNMWNTMPAHTHDRRTECYLYFDLPHDARVIHLMGEPTETRHLIVGNDQAVISPSWSVHSGFGTKSYSFVWAMAGENKTFDDMDSFPVSEMR